MPANWHDRHAIGRIDDEVTREFYHRIVADKKPYFMRYIYPPLMKQYNNYIKNTNKNCLREFGLTMEELLALPASELTERQCDFVGYYKACMPVGTGDCVMNKICRRFEVAFDGYLTKKNKRSEFDYTIMKSGAVYSRNQRDQIIKLYEEYNRHVRDYKVFCQYERVDEDTAIMYNRELRNEFMRACTGICPDRFALCDILLDICYKRSSTKKLVWDVCGSEIVFNLLKRNGGLIWVPVRDEAGEISFAGDRFTAAQYRIDLEDFYEFNFE